MKTELQVIQETLTQRFKASPAAIAITWDQKNWSYKDLETNYVSWISYFHQSGITPGNFIGIATHNKIEAISLMLASLFMKSIFVPMDVSHPAERIVSMLKSVDVNHVFVDEGNDALREQLKASGFTIHKAEAIASSNNLPFSEKLPEYQADDPIYVYFTSGTEGAAKGVVGRNISLSHFIDWEINTLALNEKSKVSQLCSLGFDASLRDIFVTLCAGGTICIPKNREQILSSEQLIDWIDASGVQLTQGVQARCVPGPTGR